MRTAEGFLLLAALLLTGTMVPGCSGPRPINSESAASTLWQPAPDFALPGNSGRTVHLSDYRGRVIALDFWATWCEPCKAQIPWLAELERKYKAQGFAVIGVAMDETGWRTVIPFIERVQIPYRIVLGNPETERLFRVVRLPATLVISRDGRIAAVQVGVVDRKRLETVVEELIRRPAGA